MTYYWCNTVRNYSIVDVVGCPEVYLGWNKEIENNCTWAKNELPGVNNAGAIGISYITPCHANTCIYCSKKLSVWQHGELVQPWLGGEVLGRGPREEEQGAAGTLQGQPWPLLVRYVLYMPSFNNDSNGL